MGQNSKLVFLGGIMINTQGAHDLFYPIRFEAVMKDGSSVDLMEAFDE